MLPYIKNKIKNKKALEKYCGPRCNFLFTTTVLPEQLKKKGEDYRTPCKHLV
jgi:hypothetical protein